MLFVAIFYLKNGFFFLAYIDIQAHMVYYVIKDD